MEYPPTSLSSYDIGTGVVSRLVGDEMILVHLDSETYFGLNRTGSVIWTELERRTPVPEIVTAIVDRFDVSAERAAADVRTLLDELGRFGLARRSA
ncbi:MAG: PqqD family protein [Actinomycetota bacterium]|nr:PqqD family protein [Actinomycetota bacterium]